MGRGGAIVVGGLLLALPAAAGAAESCVEVANATQYWMPGEARSPGLRSAAFHVQAGSTLRVCLAGAPQAGEAIEVTIKSGWGWPVVSCKLVAGGGMRLERQLVAGEERTVAICR